MSLTELRRYLITGLLIWVPVVITLWVLSLVVGTLDQVLVLLPKHWQPDALFGFHVPGFGVVVTLTVLFLTGVLVSNYLGRQLLRVWEQALARIPVVKTIYTSVKQVSDTLFSSSGQAFRKALLVQYPHQGSWTIAFQTGSPGRGVKEHLDGDFVSVYVPTTPNPTSGFFLMMPKRDVVELDMSVDEALKYIISMGVVAPSGAPR